MAKPFTEMSAEKAAFYGDAYDIMDCIVACAGLENEADAAIEFIRGGLIEARQQAAEAMKAKCLEAITGLRGGRNNEIVYVNSSIHEAIEALSTEVDDA